MQAVLAAATSLPGLGAVQRWVLAGHSMGARVACSIANEQQQQQQQPVTAVLLSSYPLHPPGKPTELRDALLHALRVPALLIRGTKDPFSQAEQWEGALRRMSCSWQQHSVEGGDHGLRIGGKDGAAKSQQALEEVGAAVQRFLRQTADRGQQQRQQQAAGRGRGTAGRGRKRVAAVGSSPSEGGKKVARRQQK